ncbi:SDR family NAD(P)-dependent oxidoreductase [Xanthobacter versatilis]|uniref:SDR family NAD(P)-dependent oxidoreductase n=1 Tax=Xanthobacter autotrophicus (strain ATCC BAA-1158 / Py2) TaxID=78245 RepID=UPI003727057D
MSNAPVTPALDGIAIIGMSGRFPGSGDIAAFWRALLEGRECITRFTDEELMEAGIPAAVLRQPNYVKAGSYLDAIDQFDAAFFGISPREAELMDPQQRLFLEHAWLALEDAGIVPERFAGEIAVFGGASFSTYGLLHLRAEIGSVGSLETVLGNDKDYLATRVSYKLGLRGPSVSVQTACSTSLTAVAMACDSLLNLQADVALAGGVTVKLPLKSGYLFEDGSILSPDGHCRAFDVKARGTIFGSGVGVVALKRLEDAVADGDPIHAVIRGWGVNNDGDHKVGFSAPSVDGQARVIATALAQAGISPDTISYVEAHGTGTPLGDPIEVRALTRAYGSGARRADKCGIGSVKTNVGHLESAAGITGLIKAALAVKHGVIPPSLNFETPNPEIDFPATPFRVVDQLTPWPAEGHPRRAGVNSFGMGGTNVHMVLEQAPAVPAVAPQVERQVVERPEHLLVLSARSAAALRDLARSYAGAVAEAGTGPLGDMAFTAATARRHFPHRLAVTARAAEELAAQLVAFADGGAPDLSGEAAAVAPEVAFLFSGQGSQYAGMGRALYEASPRFRRTLDRCDAILRPLMDRPLLSVLFPAPGDEGLIDETIYTQPALFSLGYALGDLWRSWGVKPSVMLGHSVGEYAAATLAGVFTLEEGLKLIAARGRLMQALPRDGVMMTVFAAEAEVAAAVAPYAADVSIAAVNAPRSTVISGRRAAVEAIAAGFEAKGVKARALTTSHAFHSPLMQPMMAAFRALAESVAYGTLDIPILSNLTGRLETTALASADYWCRHVLAPVRFLDGISAAAARGISLFVEIGPRPVLCALGRETLDGAPGADGRQWLASLRRPGTDWRTLLDSLGRLHLAGVEIDWAGFDADYARRRVRLPGYAFQRRSFWAAPRAGGAASGKVRGVATGTDHPLLGQRLRQAGTKEVRFEAALNATDPAFLTDHRVFDAVVLPATGYLEMALAGGAHLFATDELTLEDISFKQVMTLPDAGERIVQAVFVPASGKAYSFEIFSGDAAGNEWTLHCSGTVKPAEDDTDLPADDETLDAARRRCDAPVPVASVYENYLKRGLAYGPAFRGIADLAAGEGETLAHIVLPDAARDGAEAYRLHPALMDACFQALGAAFGAMNDADTYLPVSLDRLTVRGLVPGDIFSHSRLHGGEGEGVADHVSTLRLFDAQGAVAAEAVGLKSRRITRDVVLPQDAGGIDTWLYDLAWESAETPSGVEGPGAGPWVLLGGDGLARAIAARLDLLGWSALLLPAGEVGRLPELLATGALAGLVDLRALASSDVPPPDAAQRASADLLALVQALIVAGRTRDLPLVVLTRGAQGGVVPDEAPAGEGVVEEGVFEGLAAAPLWGLVRTVWHEYPDLPATILDLAPEAATDEAAQIAAELTGADGEQQVAYRAGRRFVARLKHHQSTAAQSRLDIPDTPYRIDRTPEGGLDRLLVVPHARRRPQAGEVELEVLGMGLNFRDVLNAMGLYPGEAGPFGGECSGRVLRVGPGVTGLAPGDAVVAMHFGTFASHVTLPAAVVFKVPQGMGVVEAAGLPIVYLTTWYGLHHLAGIKAGDRVLIHSASGGVGIAAIRVAQMVGAEIFATASPHKHDFLRSLGVTHIMNSRDTAFADEIMRLTGGRGVDIVLNSLGGEAIPASLSVVAPGGHFVEIGKRDIWSVDEARAVRGDITYSIVNFDITAVEEPELVRALLAEALELMSSGALGQPVTTVYGVEDALDAMAAMQKARHTGKLVLATPAAGERRGDFAADATYLVTGAFGGIGRLVAGWMVERGARTLALVGRRPPDREAEAAIAALRAAGARVEVFAADVGDEAALAQVLAAVDAGMPALRGVIHAAGVLDDGVLTALDPARLESVFAAKVRGAYALHRATAHRPLDLFVLFSSLGSVLGAPGQANYAAANAFLDRLAHARRAKGLPALAINWGGWQDTGMTAGGAVAANLAYGGSIPPAKGLTILGQLMREGAAEVGVAPFDWRLYFEGLPRRLSVLAHVERELEQAVAAAETFAALRTALRGADAARRDGLLLDYLRGVVGRLLRLEGGEVLSETQPLQELGLDSLVSIQLRNRIRAELEIDLPVAEMMEAGSLAQLVAVAAGKIAPVAGEGAPPPAGIVPLHLAEAPASFAQQRLWFLSRLDPGSAFYTVTFSLFLEGPFEPAAFARAAAEIVRRHGALRTSFPEVDGAPVQRIRDDLALPLEWVDLSGLSEAERERQMARRVEEESRRTFDLAEGPLFKLTVLQLGAELQRAIVAIHHIVTDGWSAVVFIQELGALYRAFSRGETSPLPELPVQYTDFSVWQRDWLSGPRLAAELDYWRGQLAAPLPVLDLPTDRPRTGAVVHRGGAFTVMLPKDLADGLKALGRSAGAGLFATLMAGFRILLHRLTEAPDIVIGSLVANRDRPEIEGLIGFFANMVVFRGNLSGDPTVRAALAREAETVRGGLAHQDVPFEKLVEELKPERHAGRNPLCDVILVLQRGVPKPDLDARDLKIGPVWDLDNGTVRFDLEVHVWETDQGLSTSFIYNADLFDAASVEQLERQFAAVLAAMVEAPDLPVSRLPLASAVPDGGDALARTLQQIENLSDAEVDALLREMMDEGVDHTP